MMEQQNTKAKNQRVVWFSLIAVIGMFGFGFALVPLYDVFCEITGLNGKTDPTASTKIYEVDQSRTITVEFVATVNGLPWKFEPLQKKVTVHPGELSTVSYTATNLSSSDIVGQAIPSVTPGPAASFFSKTECFCFTNQLLKAGETREMPVYFVIDPLISKDISIVTLSYTFFKIDATSS
jgi:cytochrome c oxidase assembly protein subunit 11